MDTVLTYMSNIIKTHARIDCPGCGYAMVAEGYDTESAFRQLADEISKMASIITITERPSKILEDDYSCFSDDLLAILEERYDGE